jgi:hypothetical protein
MSIGARATPREGPRATMVAWVAHKRHQEVELRRREVDPLPSRANEVSGRLIEAPRREHVEPLCRFDGLRAADFEVAAPDGFINCGQSLPGLFENMDLHRARLQLSALRIVTVK